MHTNRSKRCRLDCDLHCIQGTPIRHIKSPTQRHQDGLHLHFLNPRIKFKPVDAEDGSRVLEHLSREHGLQFHGPSFPNDDALTVELNCGDSDAVLFISLSLHGRATGNARLRAGGSRLGPPFDIYRVLLSSAWFSDSCTPNKLPTELLPMISTAPVEDMVSVMRSLGSRLGVEGKRMLEEFIAGSGADQGGNAHYLLRECVAAAAQADRPRITCGKTGGPGVHCNAGGDVNETLTIYLKNWRQLTNNEGGFKIGALHEGMAEANWSKADCILATEVGATSGSKLVDIPDFEFDYEVSDKAAPGRGVGALFGPQWKGRWVHLDMLNSPTNSRVYLCEKGGVRVVLGVFYAPHAGHPSEVRSNFYKQLSRAWCKARRMYPGAWRILAGDANLPSLEKDLAGCKTGSETKLNQLFSDLFLIDLRLANCAKGEAQPTHNRGAVLDLILVDKGLVVDNVSVGAKGIGASDHSAVIASFRIPGIEREQEPMRWKNADKPCWRTFGDEMESPHRGMAPLVRTCP